MLLDGLLFFFFFFLKMTFDMKATVIWRRAVRIEIPFPCWITLPYSFGYPASLGISLLSHPSDHNRDKILFLPNTLIQCERLKREVQTLPLRQEVAHCVCINFAQIEKSPSLPSGGKAHEAFLQTNELYQSGVSLEQQQWMLKQVRK